MRKPPSDKTLLAAARKDIRRLESELSALHSVASGLRIRATQAEQSAAEWKKRFDQLLEFRKQIGE